MSQDINAPLDFGFNVNEIDTSRPVLVAGPYPVSITKVEVVRNKRDDGNNLKVTYRVEKEATTEKGAVIPAGTHSITQYLPLAPEEASRVIRLFDAALNTGQGTRPNPLSPALLVGKTLLANIRIEPAQGEYDKSNGIGSVAALGQTAAVAD